MDHFNIQNSVSREDLAKSQKPGQFPDSSLEASPKIRTSQKVNPGDLQNLESPINPTIASQDTTVNIQSQRDKSKFTKKNVLTGAVSNSY